MFNLDQFVVLFAADIEALAASEKITKAKLMDMSRYMLEAIHATGDIRPINQLLTVLTPMNRKTAVLYFSEFSGFKWDADESIFTKKNQKQYDAVQAKAIAFLEDPHNNIWTWADRNVSLEVKPVDFSKLTKSVESMLKKAAKEGIANPQVEIMRAVLAGGIELETLLTIMTDMGVEVLKEPIDAPQE